MKKAVILACILAMLSFFPLWETAGAAGVNAESNDEARKIETAAKKQETGKDLFVFRQRSGKYGYMDRDGNIIVKAQFDSAYDFVDGVARVVNYYTGDYRERPDGTRTSYLRHGFVGADGKMITSIKFGNAQDFHGGLAWVEEVDGSQYYIDKKGNRSPQKFVGMKYFTQGFMPECLSQTWVNCMPVEVWSYIDSTGEQITEQEFEAAEEFSDGFAIVKRKGKYGVIDTDFKTVIDYKYDDLSKVDIDLFAAKKGKKWGLVDTSGKVIVAFKYYYIGSFSEGLAPVCTAVANWTTEYSVYVSFKDSAYMDRNGKLFLMNRFSMTAPFVDGHAIVRDKGNDLFGVIDRSGNYVIKPKYFHLHDLKGGLIKVRDGATVYYYYIDLNGNKIVPQLPMKEKAGAAITNTQSSIETDKKLFVFAQNGKFGYMDNTGKIIVKAKYDWVHDFAEGIGRVANYVKNYSYYPSGPIIPMMRYGFVAANGKMITPVQFYEAGDFHEGLALVDGIDGVYYIDRSGNRSPQKVVLGNYFTKGFKPKCIRGGYEGPPMPDPPPDVWSYIDSTGELVTEQEFEWAGEFSDGLAIVRQNGKYGVIDTEFKTVLAYKYDDLNRADAGLFAAKKGEKWGLIDSSGNVVVAFTYYRIGSFSGGLAPVSKKMDNNKEYGGYTTYSDDAYIDRTGKIFFDNRFTTAYGFIDGYAVVRDKESGQYGVIDRLGNYVIEPQYNYLYGFNDGLFGVGYGYDYIDLQGNKIVPH